MGTRRKTPHRFEEIGWLMRLPDWQPRTKESGEIPMRTFVLAELPELALNSPIYTEAQNQLAEVEGATKTEK